MRCHSIGWGYGCGLYKRLDNSGFSITGGDAGVGFESRFIMKEGLTINILSNITNGESDIRRIVREYL